MTADGDLWVRATRRHRLQRLDLARRSRVAQAGQANDAVAPVAVVCPLTTPRGRARGGKLGSSTRRCPPTVAATQPGPARGREGSERAKDLHRRAWQTSLDSWQSCAGCGKRGEREASAAASDFATEFHTFCIRVCCSLQPSCIHSPPRTSPLHTTLQGRLVPVLELCTAASLRYMHLHLSSRRELGHPQRHRRARAACHISINFGLGWCSHVAGSTRM